MKIKITTIREIDDCDYNDWINAINMGPSGPIDGNELLKKGSFTYTSVDRLGHRKTSATTTYQILREG